MKGTDFMETICMLNAKFIDHNTIKLLESYPFIEEEVYLIIMPKKVVKQKRKAGILKGKIRIDKDFNEPLEDMKEYMK
ncbi:MAG: DUF2281 domain-containing protein [Desulfobacterales bacterium]|nr:DUF2281 domain-containing protein [Desulfobacterales bacterium]